MGYGAPGKTFGAPYMVSNYLILTDCSYVATGSHFSPCADPGIYYGTAVDAVANSVWVMHHPLFDGAAPCLYVSFVCFSAAPPGYLDVVGERIC